MISDIASLVFIGLGSLFVFSAAVGLVRFKDTLSRVHVITKPQTVGLILTVIGAIIRVIGSPDFNIAHRGDLGILVLLVLFALMTGPVTGQRVGRISRREGLYGPPDHLSVNEAPAQRAVKRKR